jgi:uncharacterized membrane protein YbhN (UPF0104 family)
VESADPGAVVETSTPRPIIHRAARIAIWLAVVALVLYVLQLLGIPVWSWIHKFFQELRAVPTWAIVSGIALDTVQTTFAALSWVTILRAAFPKANVSFRLVLACYAVAVALNGFLPANIGTLVMMVMFTSLIVGATFAAIFSGFLVQKIGFTVLSVANYLYLFATVGGSLSLELPFVSKHPGFAGLIVLGGTVLIVLLVRIFWRRAAKQRERLKSGGAVLKQPRRFVVGVALPQVVSYAARLGLVAVFMAAYSIPVTFHAVMSVTAANSLSSSLSVTPGGVGVTQALNVAVLNGSTSKANATAYSVAQQLVVAAWDVLFAIILVAWVFGWSGGKELIRQSYAAAEVKRDELQEQRQKRREERPPRWRLHR